MTASGLDGVVVAQTALSQVDGAAGRLIVRGRLIEELAGRVSFEETARLLWEGLAPPVLVAAGDAAAGPAPRPNPEKDQAEGVRAVLASARAAAFGHLLPLRAAAARLRPVEALRLGLSSLGGASPAAHLDAAGAVPVFVAGFERLRQGLAPVPPAPELGQAADFLRMLRGERSGPEEEQALDAYLVTVAEHGMNASTFTARVVASTRAGVLPAVIAALSALEGPLHGGAPGPVLDMLDALAALGGGEERRRWLAGELAAGRRLMGFGHRIYRVRDPRADVLKEQVRQLRSAGSTRLAFAEDVEREALAALARHRPDRRLDTNVEFYTALLLEAVGIPRHLFTPVFAIGRVAGWTAHVYEQEKEGRLIRPQSDYVGPMPAAA